MAVSINHKSEESMIRLRRGKWSQPGVPHHGWICVGMEDLGEPTGQCEMCEAQAIRYVHQMKHPEYPDELGVGCVCAEHMETDKGASRSREKDLKNVAEKRKRWLTRKWRLSKKGNPFLNTHGCHVTVFDRLLRWGAVVSRTDDNEKCYAPGSYASEELAKEAAFNLLIRKGWI